MPAVACSLSLEGYNENTSRREVVIPTVAKGSYVEPGLVLPKWCHSQSHIDVLSKSLETPVLLMLGLGQVFKVEEGKKENNSGNL